MAGIRETWNSRTAFVLAAIGSAIGLGNIWRFPYVTYENGGGAFLVAYFICLFLAGIPLLMLEFSIGHKFHQAAPGSFKRISPRLEWFGWFAAGVGFIIVTYYAIIMAWSVNYTYEAATLGWEQEEGLYADVQYAITETDIEDMAVLTDVPDSLLGRTFTSPVSADQGIICADPADPEGFGTILVAFGGHLYGFNSVGDANTFMGSPGDFFFNDFLGVTSSPWDMGDFKWPLFIGFTLAWIWIVASVWKGTKTVSKVVYFTVLIPWCLLLLFVIRGLTLPGAGTGIRFYLTPVWSNLMNSKLWLAAISQVFFSLSVGFAIMIAYGSFLPKKTNIAANAMIIGIADALTAFFGGLAVFSALGHHASSLGVPVSQVVSSGPGLAFVAYPHIITTLPAARIFGVLFFLMLLTLAVDSAFSLLEAVTASVKDKWNTSHKKANLIVGGLAFLLGLPMLTGMGIHILDIADHFMNSFGLTLVVLGEVLIIGWGTGADEQRQYINSNSSFNIGLWWNICIRWIIPMGILWMIFSEIQQRVVPYGSFSLRSQEFIFGWLLIILLPIVSDLLASSKGSSEMK
ncbi:MAG: sodium-dependent transporter [Candidatus Aegiribacteria sp.]|nr:sodium-dependent transporter [Candidatus Aegiribacteria sp.]